MNAVLRETAQEARMSEREVFQLGLTYAVVAVVVSFFLVTTVLALLAEVASRMKAKHVLDPHLRSHPRGHV
jgi:hypothetical protein